MLGNGDAKIACLCLRICLGVKGEQSPIRDCKQSYVGTVRYGAVRRGVRRFHAH
jgi:hypothetical protein